MTNETEQAQLDAESPGTEAEVVPTQTEILQEALASAHQFPQVSGIGSEIGTLKGLLERCLDCEELGDEEIEYALLVTERAREVMLNYQS